MAKFIKWYVNTNQWYPTRDQWLALASSVPSEELRRIENFCYKEDSKSSLIGQVLIRKFLSNVIKKPTNEIQLIRSDLGRPKVLESYKNQLISEKIWPNVIDFNVSHSGDYCVLAGVWSFNENCPELKVGVDVTKIVKKKTKQELDRFLDLMSRREFTQKEWETVTGVQDDKQKCINFTRLWCLKESFIKAIGLGLTFNLRRIEFHFDELYKYNISTNYLKNTIHRGTYVLSDNNHANDWVFQETALDDDHLVALGYKRQDDKDSNTEIEFDLSPFEEMEIDFLIEGLSPIAELSDQNWFHFNQKRIKDHII